MPSVGLGVVEIRINIGNAYRIFYMAKFEEGIYVLHAFQKKSQRTSKQDIAVLHHSYRMFCMAFWV